jgi:hypothetical protein
MVIFLAVFIFSHGIALKPIEILFHPCCKRGVIFVCPGARLLEQCDSVEHAYEVTCVDDSGPAAVIATGNRLAVAKMRIHPCGRFEEPGAHKHRAVRGRFILVQKITGKGKGFQVVVEHADRFAIAFGQ